jgi:hypothetical protein
MRRRGDLYGVGLAVVFLVLAGLACGGSEAEQPPSITITNPASGTTVAVGEEVQIVSMAVADAGVARVELSINGQVVRSDTPPQANPTTFSVSQPWTPAAEGEVTVSVVAYDVEGAASEPATITLRVGAGAPATPAAQTPTPVPDEEGEGGCTLNAAFAADVTVPDNTEMSPGETFVKTWRIRNSGTCDWGAGFTLVFVGGEQMGAPASVPVPATAAGSTVDVSVNMAAPSDYGTYRSNWRVESDTGAVFGSSVYVQIVVPAPATATPTEEPTPTPTEEPTAGPAVPAAPSNLHVTSWSGIMANMAFNDNSDDEQGFRVYANGSVHMTLNPNETSFQVGPPCGTTYAVYVVAYNTAGESDPTGTINVAGACLPVAPSNLRVTSWSGNMANMRFNDNSDNEQGFRVYVNGGVYRTLGPNETTFQVGPPCGATYAVYVVAYNLAGESGPTGTINVAGACLPAAPSNLRVTSWSGNMANMAFNDNSDNEQGFRVYVNGGVYRTLGPNVATFQVGPPCGATYAVYVVAYNASGESGPSGTINVGGACP